MPDQPVSLFINPTAGRGRAGQRLDAIRQIFAAAGTSLTVVESLAVGDLEEKVTAQVNGGVNQVIIAGGDGSIHEAVNGLMRADKACSVGVIPTGTGNDFAKACGITVDWQQATQLLAQRIAAAEPTKKIDIGRMNDRYFANGLGIGFDAKATRVARSLHWPIGDLVYLLAILRCLYDGVATPELAISSEGDPWRGPVTMASICNGPWVGGMFHIAPPANNADGRLDLLIAGPVSRLRILALLPMLMRGKHMREPEIVHRTVQTVTVTAAAPVESHLDGEVQPLQTRFDIEVLPGALDLL